MGKTRWTSSIKLWLGIVCLALLAAPMSAAATTGQFTADEYPATVEGELVEKLAFQLGEAQLTCEGGTLSGSLSSASSSLELTPAFTSCVAAGTAATLSMNGCKFVSNIEEGEPFGGAINTSCPESQVPTVTWALGKCHANIWGAGVVGPAVRTVDTFPKKDITETVTAKNVPYTLVNTGFPCLQKAGNYNNGVITGRWTLRARNKGGSSQNFWMG